MQRDRVGREGIDDQDVEAARCHLRKFDAGIADHDPSLGRAAFQECEYSAARKAQDLRVDLEERPRLPGLPVTGERADPQSNHADAGFRTEQPSGRIEREPYSRAWAV